jgi:hypothetical protein
VPAVGGAASIGASWVGCHQARRASPHSAHTPVAVIAAIPRTMTASGQRRRNMNRAYHASSKCGIMRAMRPRVVSGLVAAAAALALVGLIAGTADAKPKKKYHFQLVDEVAAADAVPAASKAEIVQVVKAQAEKALASHAQIVASVAGAPDPKVDPKGFKKYLSKKNIAGAYRVNVEITELGEETEPVDDKPGDLRLIVRLSLRMFGETIPDRGMAFSGDGSATIKTEIGKKLRPRDRQFALESAAEMAVADALSTSLTKLAMPPPKPSKK